MVRPVAAGTNRPFETFIKITADGSVTAFNGHVDLGTGIRTALGQIVAEELDVSFARVVVVLGDTSRVPNQGATIASETIQISAVPLRKAAAQARQFLIARAAERLELPLEELAIEDGLVRGHNRSISYGELIGDDTIRLELADDVEVKSADTYRVVGQSVPRVDLPAKATGELVYVHDVRVPGMLHGRVVRPPYAGVDGGDFVGTSLIDVDESSVRDIPGLIAVVRIADFVGVVAEREENAIKAAAELKLTWKKVPTLPDLKDIETALRANPSTPRTLIDKGDVDAALSQAAKTDRRAPMSGLTRCTPRSARPARSRIFRKTRFACGPARKIRTCCVATWRCCCGVPNSDIEIIRMEAAGCYGRNCADDVCADAVLLSRAVGRPVRVQLTREQEHVWEPKGTAQLIDVKGGLNADGGVAAYDFASRYPSNAAPTLALLLTGTISPTPLVSEMGDRTAIPPYDYDNLRVVAHDMPPIMRAAWLRGVSALPNTFAHESYIDELASEAGVDPIEYRLRYLKDPRAIDLVKAVAERADWQPRPVRQEKENEGDIAHGRGFAYALYVHSKFPGYGAAWSAWIADVAVNTATGDVSVTRVIAGQDSGLMINPDGVRHQIEGNVIQSTSRALMEEVSFSGASVASREWGAYPIIKFPDLPKIDVLMLPRNDQPPLGVGESASVPSAAAIANAIYDATGVRFREPPFTPERILAGLRGEQTLHREALPSPGPAPANSNRWSNPFHTRRGVLATAAALVAGGIGIATAMLPWRSIAPIARPDASVFSAATIERGRQLAALGDCAICHTSINGVLNAGGRPIETPFGVIYSTNITPDVETGIGNWSYPAFERAMREGIHRDGRQLYPAFPYTHFAKSSDADLQALYAFLMAETPVKSENRAHALAFPFNWRPLLAGWNALFHNAEPFTPDPKQLAVWNRGAYLVEGLGHCGGCHSPRNALGAEKTNAYLAGGFAEGWEAPALTSLSHAPIPWNEDELFAYLRTGTSRFHGVAAGPMTPVVQELKALPDEDIRAMAVYLASFNENARQTGPGGSGRAA